MNCLKNNFKIYIKIYIKTAVLVSILMQILKLFLRQFTCASDGEKNFDTRTLFPIKIGEMTYTPQCEIITYFLWISFSNIIQITTNVSQFSEFFSIIRVNNQIDALFCVYFTSLHVSSNTVLIIRRINCINTSSRYISLGVGGRLVCRSESSSLTCIPNGHLHRVIYTR